MITVNTKDMKQAMDNAKRFVCSKKSELEILKGIAVQTQDDNCVLFMATNLEDYFVQAIGADADESARLVIEDIKPLMKAVKFFGEETTLKQETCNLIVQSDNKKTVLNTLDFGEFPSIPADRTAGCPLNFDTGKVYSQYKKIKASLSSDEVRPMLGQICFRKDKMIATDGFRAAIIPCPHTFETDVLLHGRVLNNLDLFGDQVVDLRYTGNEVFGYSLRSDDMLLTGNVYDGNFPDISFLIKNNYKEVYPVDRKEFIKAIEFLVAVMDDNVCPIKFDNGTLSFVLEGQETSIKLNGEFDSLTVYGFCGKFMLDALKYQFDGDVVNIHVFTGSSPIQIEDGNDQNGLYILMPMLTDK